MGAITASWIARVLDFSTFNPTTTLYGCIYHYIGGLSTLHGIIPVFSYIYMTQTSFLSQNCVKVSVPASFADYATPTIILHEVHPNIRTFFSLRDWTSTASAPNDSCMGAHEE